jgi:hypothetical protein
MFDDKRFVISFPIEFSVDFILIDTSDDDGSSKATISDG